MKILEFIGSLLVVIAFFWIVGTAGALEWNNISVPQFFFQVLIGFIIGAIGVGLIQLAEAIK